MPAGKHKGGAGSPPPQPPFSVKLLVDEATVHAQKAAVTQLTVAPANRIALHRHPGAELLYVLRGHARVLGAAGVTPEKLDPGMAIYIPPSMPHAIENMGRQSPAVLLEVFVPPGPEKVYRDPKDPSGRAAFEVLHDPKVANPDGAKFVVVAPVATDALPILGGKGKATPLLDVPHTGNRAIFLGKLEVEPGAELPRHAHPGVDEILFVAAGAGELTVGSEKFPFEAPVALYIPAGQPHAAKFTGTDKGELVQIYAPAGPEDRYKDLYKDRSKDAPRTNHDRFRADRRPTGAAKVRARAGGAADRPAGARAGTKRNASRTRSSNRWGRWASSACRSRRATAAPG